MLELCEAQCDRLQALSDAGTQESGPCAFQSAGQTGPVVWLFVFVWFVAQKHWKCWRPWIGLVAIGTIFTWKSRCTSTSEVILQLLNRVGKRRRCGRSWDRCSIIFVSPTERSWLHSWDYSIIEPEETFVDVLVLCSQCEPMIDMIERIYFVIACSAYSTRICFCFHSLSVCFVPRVLVHVWSLLVYICVCAAAAAYICMRVRARYCSFEFKECVYVFMDAQPAAGYNVNVDPHVHARARICNACDVHLLKHIYARIVKLNMKLCITDSWEKLNYTITTLNKYRRSVR